MKSHYLSAKAILGLISVSFETERGTQRPSYLADSSHRANNERCRNYSFNALNNNVFIDFQEID